MRFESSNALIVAAARSVTIITAMAIAAVTLGGCDGGIDERNIPSAQPAGETSVQVGDYTVHYNAMSTDRVPPDVAKAYGIVRSNSRAMITVAVVTADGESIATDVSVDAVNLTGQLKNISMRKVQEQDSVYYIGEVPVANRETLVFDVEVTPPGESAATKIKFKRQFYTD